LLSVRSAKRPLYFDRGVTLALGIGANTALFSTFNTFVLHPLTLAAVRPPRAHLGDQPGDQYNTRFVSWPRYEFFRDHQQSFSNYRRSRFASYALVRAGADPEQLNSFRSAPNFFPTLGVTPLHGRNFTKEEDTAGGPDVAVLSYECCSVSSAGATPLSRKRRLGGTPYLVVGILPPALSNPYNTVMVFVPRAFDTQDNHSGKRCKAAQASSTSRHGLKDGVTFEQAAAEVKALAQNYGAAFPMHLDGKHDNVTKTFAEETRRNFKPTFYLLLAAVGLVMLIACANIAALFFGRLSTRRKEIDRAPLARRDPGQLDAPIPHREPRVLRGGRRARVIFGWWALDLIQHAVAGAAGNNGVAASWTRSAAHGRETQPGWPDPGLYHRHRDLVGGAGRLRAGVGGVAHRGGGSC